MQRSRTVTRLSAVVVITLLASLTTGFRSPDNAVQAKWTAYVVHTQKGEADIHFTADIPGGWKMYSQSMTGVDGPLATNIEFDPSPAFNIVGAPAEKGKSSSFYANDLGMEVKCLEGKAQYVQHISYTSTETFAVKCVINYMLCRDGEILPPDDEDFTISIEP
jgi:thiol:disulfide interchange protein DsbD